MRHPPGTVPPQSPRFVTRLRGWACGQGDPIYAVASSWTAGKNVPVALVERASCSVAMARGDLRRVTPPRPRAIAALDRLEARLDRLVAKYRDPDAPDENSQASADHATVGP